MFQEKRPPNSRLKSRACGGISSKILSNGYPFQRWKGDKCGYELTYRQYSATGIDIHVIPNETASRYLPYIYVRTDDEGSPTGVQIETISYGTLPAEEYKELQREMSYALAVAESIEEKFIANAAQRNRYRWCYRK